MRSSPWLLRGLVLLFLAAGLPAAPVAEDPAVTPAEAVASMQKALQAVSTLQARFEQLHYSVSVSMPLREKGELYLEKPDRMRWEYRDPQNKVFLYKAGVLETYLPEEKQLTRSPVPEEALKTDIFGLLLGRMSFEEAYTVEDSPFPDGGRPGPPGQADPQDRGGLFPHPARDRRGDLAAAPGHLPRVGREQARIRLQPGPDGGPHPRSGPSPSRSRPTPRSSTTRRAPSARR
ncbi:MAG: outer membrane lipoprotein carrier protein LolA [Marinilabiliales bacterium]|nr:outer membrane lipoprotein carrier protein LolA [Marinilabiliales bacterium]